MSHLKRLTKLDLKKTFFMLCDIQEKFRKVLPLFPGMVENSSKLIKAGKNMDIPLIVTEQYPEKLGKTVKELDIKHALNVVPKTKFSMWIDPVQCEIREAFKDEKPCAAVLFGLETHVCIEQTAIDLVESDLQVFVVADCCCSRLNQDRDFAFKRLKQLGCFLTTSENVIFSLLQDKDHPCFDKVKGLVAKPSIDMQLSKTNQKQK